MHNPHASYIKHYASCIMHHASCMNVGRWLWDSEPRCRTIFLLAGLSSCLFFCHRIFSWNGCLNKKNIEQKVYTYTYYFREVISVLFLGSMLTQHMALRVRFVRCVQKIKEYCQLLYDIARLHLMVPIDFLARFYPIWMTHLPRMVIHLPRMVTHLL